MLVSLRDVCSSVTIVNCDLDAIPVPCRCTSLPSGVPSLLWRGDVMLTILRNIWSVQLRWVRLQVCDIVGNTLIMMCTILKIWPKVAKLWGARNWLCTTLRISVPELVCEFDSSYPLDSSVTYMT